MVKISRVKIDKPKMTRIHILKEIDDLLYDYDSKSSDEQAEIDVKLSELGKLLINPRRENKIKQIIEQGNPSDKELIYLRNQGFTMQEVADVAGVDYRALEKRLSKSKYTTNALKNMGKKESGYIKAAKEIGVSYRSYRRRRLMGQSKRQASTEPIGSNLGRPRGKVNA